MRINVGCGQTPTPTWRNFDNSFSLRLSNSPLLVKMATRLGLLNGSQLNFISFAMQSNIEKSLHNPSDHEARNRADFWR